MNLAELRKKAQKDKKVDIGRPVVLSREPEPVEEDLAPVQLVVAPVEPPADTWSGFAPPLDEPAAGPVKAGGGAPAVFDPVAVLLAGRETALADEVAFADAAAAAEAGNEEFREFLCFRVSTEIYAINIMEIKEIIKPRAVTEVPRAPAFVSGVLSLRGIIIPVFNMRLRLGLPGAEKSVKERIVVLKRGEEFFGILVDEVIQVVRIAAATIEKPPAVLDGIDRDFVGGIGRFDGQMLILLNQEKILDLTLG